MSWSTNVLLASFLCACNAHNILVLFPIPGGSHTILGDGIVKPLLDAGHKVTYIAGLDKLPTHPNLNKILPADNPLHHQSMDIKLIMEKKLDFDDTNILHYFLHLSSSSTLKDENVQRLLRDNSQKFDVIIAEWMFSELYATLQAVYNCPLIWFSSVEPHWEALNLIDQPLNPAFHCDITTAVRPPFSFYDRVDQLWRQIKVMFTKRYFAGLEREVYKEVIAPHIKSRNATIPDYDDLIYNASLMLGNSHVSMGDSVNLPQSYKAIGGYHISRKVKPLPADLQNLLDNAKDGLIYFSMGSNLKSKDLPEETKQGLLRALGSFKQTVLWKFETELPDTPKNVHIVSWAPQQSILAHPNTVLFITHGGLLSTTEAIHFGKPIVGIPVFADQFINIQRAVNKGFARKVDLSYNMEDDLKREVNEIFSNPEYSRKAKEISFVYHDRLTLPTQEIVHWTEHVIKTNGAPHLKSPALLVPWYQKLYLDLFSLLIVILIIKIIALKAVWNYVIFQLYKTQRKQKKQ